jgi:type III restriction enzyme
MARPKKSAELPPPDWTPQQAVDEPVINNPWDEPAWHWIYDPDGHPVKQQGRRPASYYYRDRKVAVAQGELFAEEQRDELPLVNRLRADVKRWRGTGYKGATKTTRDLLRWWKDPQRSRRLFYCQLEAVETIIYLLELALPERLGATGYRTFEVTSDDFGKLLGGEVPDFPELKDTSEYFPRLVDTAGDTEAQALLRFGLKMATGSGKTVVMAMLVAWAFANRAVNPASFWFPNAVLIMAPNLTVKERLQVLRPDNADNYYDQFDLVPPVYREHLNTGRVLVTNWHVMALASENSEGGKSYKVVQKGEESAEAFARNRLGELADRAPILVLNDEGHHCWRPRQGDRIEADDLTAEEKSNLKEEEEEARVWLAGLDRINNSGIAGPDQPGILACVDLSATPFYLAGSGHPEGSPFPWLVADFGLVDAIECGIVKVPRMPVKDNLSGTDDAGRPDPEYFRLWDHLLDDLTPGDFIRKRPKPEVLRTKAGPALAMLYSQWKERFDRITTASQGETPIPPVMIIVCENTDLSKALYEYISGETDNEDGTISRGHSPFPEFRNTDTQHHTFRIDSKLLAKAEAEGEATKDEAAAALRELIGTVGRRGKPGEQVRCVVSVSMLTEGWDASNVTHVFGLRPFRSQLLCEQVVGRGLRRMSYTPDPETGLLPAEYVDVYGIPFSLVPYKGNPKDEVDTPDPVYHHIYAVPEKSAFEIRVPVVEGYTYALRGEGIVCNVEGLDETFIDEDPTEVFVAAPKGYVDGQSRRPETEFIKQTRAAYYQTVRLQEIYFRIAQDIVRILDEGQDRNQIHHSRHRLFPEVLAIVERYAQQRVRFGEGVDHREIAHQKHVERIRSLLVESIRPAAASVDKPLVAILSRFRRTVSTAEVSERTARPVVPLEKSHLNKAIILSSDETAAIDSLEKSPFVECFASNDKHLGLAIKYEYDGNEHQYIPDFIIRLSGSTPAVPRYLVLEIKGRGGNWHPNQVSAKSAAARKWCAAVSNLGRYGQWHYDICHNPVLLPEVLAAHAQGKPKTMASQTTYKDSLAGSIAAEVPDNTPWVIVPPEQRQEWENCLPLVALKILAGASEPQLSFESLPGWAEYWVRPKSHIVVEKGMFVAQVHSSAMEPLIPSGSYCLFRPALPGTREGKILLVRHSGIEDPATGGRYTIRKWFTNPDSTGGFTRISLRGISADTPVIQLEPRSTDEIEVLAEWVRTL